MMLSDRTPPARWKRTQQFALSEQGTEAERTYREEIIASRAHAGRASYDAARTEWATRLKVEPDDGLYLCELRTGARRMTDLVESLETSGKTKKDAQDAIGRLVDAGLVSPLP